MAKSSKRSIANGTNNNTTTSKKKKNNKMGPEAVAMKAKAQKTNSNPFESIWSRRKFDVMGQKRKGDTKRMGLARSLAIEKRKKTLLKEYEQSTKSSEFIDRRIGENDEGLDDFGKAILRSQRERQLNVKSSKKSKYHLSEEDDDEFEGIDGLGRDDFEDEMLGEDDDETDDISDLGRRHNAHGMHSPGEAGLADGGENRHKTKKEVMNEVIAKSKFYKAEKAKEKEKDEDLLEGLDKDFTSLAHSEALLALTEPNKMKALKALVNSSISNEKSDKDSLSAKRTMNNSVQEKPDEYDQLVRQMGFEMRARPSDRLKTTEEIAQEERERLEELEKKRQKRMAAAEDSSEEDDEESEKPSKEKPRSLSGDDLGDSFSVDEETMTKKGWVDEILERRDEEEGSSSEDDDGEDSDDSERSEDSGEGSEGDLDENDKNTTLKDWEQSDDDDISAGSEGEDDDISAGSEDEDDDEDEESAAEEVDKVKGLNVGIHKKAKRNDSVESVKGDNGSSDTKKIVIGGKMSKELEIPYIIEAPKTFEELCSLVDKRSNSDTILIINRIRKSNPITLAAENRKKVQVFYGVLLQYFAVLANKKMLNVELINMLVKPLIEMSTEIPYFAAICARRRIEITRKQFVESIKNAESSSWPSSKTLCLLRLWSMVFPCSDFRHPVMTPVILLMCEYLMRCPITSGRDIAIGSFLCSMLLSVFKQSRKFCPEPIVFIQTLLLATTESKHISCENSQLYHLMELKDLKPLLRINEEVDKISTLNFFKLINMPEDSPFFTTDSFRASVLVTSVETLQGYINAYDNLSSFPEIFLPILRLLLEIAEQKNMPNALRDKIKDVAELIKLKVDEHHTLRRPLQMRKQKLVPIKLLNPKFEENYVKGRDYDPDRVRAERKKLKREVRREAKGAAREIRKDNYFLLDVKEKERSLMEKTRAEKYGRTKAFLQEQEHAFKSGQLGKGKKRSR
ncbi:putative nucleolar protein [Medicago truncatula]|uniref:Nop14 nucleolar-like protein n=2 Tax=Medicago truncatula TaxID=3880 RepID=A0A072VVU7_MEDTR|nr:nucleolar protein 14 [Medicago truncatula]KEH42220.1 Nop14 nucleolar-like protein [Medicago truncatula]RHN79788.1 putative nucleolar protein [Medicago truncatula]